MTHNRIDISTYSYIDGVFSVMLGQYGNFEKKGQIYVFLQFPQIKDLKDYRQYKKDQENTGKFDSSKLVGMKRLKLTKNELADKEVIKINDDIKRSGIVSKWGSGE